jgi:8-oxo-dGTP pyrophosphatase MutT (NUDIX family)
VTDDGRVVCVRQFRHGTRRITLEVPGGLVDPGEDPARSAVRECLEETGFAVAAPESLGVLSPNPALFPNSLHTYMALGAVRTAEIANTASEHTAVELVPVGDLPRRLLSGEIDHALVVATLWRFLHVWAQRGA